jgi:hypothetical protein
MGAMVRTDHFEECRSEKLAHLDRPIGLTMSFLTDPSAVSAPTGIWSNGAALQWNAGHHDFLSS